METLLSICGGLAGVQWWRRSTTSVSCISGDNLRKVLLELSDNDPQFRALCRYVNRKSHADSVNLNDFGEIDPRAYVERFREVFVKTNFEDHFDKIMG